MYPLRSINRIQSFSKIENVKICKKGNQTERKRAKIARKHYREQDQTKEKEERERRERKRERERERERAEMCVLLSGCMCIVCDDMFITHVKRW